MCQGGKHAKSDDGGIKKIMFFLLGLLVFIQLLMLNEQVRSQLSIVDFFEGQQIEMGKK